MKRLIAIILLFLPGCGTQNYYDSIRESNESIAVENSAIAQACADALEKVKNDPGGTVAVALTVCQKKMDLIIPEAPEKPSAIIGSVGRTVLMSAIPWAFIEVARSGNGTRYDVGGDYVSNNGSGSAGKVESTTEILAPEEKEEIEIEAE